MAVGESWGRLLPCLRGLAYRDGGLHRGRRLGTGVQWRLLPSICRNGRYADSTMALGYIHVFDITIVVVWHYTKPSLVFMFSHSQGELVGC